MTEAEIRADERARCAEELRQLNAEHLGYEWVRFSVWDRIIERCAKRIEGMSPSPTPERASQ